MKWKFILISRFENRYSFCKRFMFLFKSCLIFYDLSRLSLKVLLKTPLYYWSGKYHAYLSWANFVYYKTLVKHWIYLQKTCAIVRCVYLQELHDYFFSYNTGTRLNKIYVQLKKTYRKALLVKSVPVVTKLFLQYRFQRFYSHFQINFDWCKI